MPKIFLFIVLLTFLFLRSQAVTYYLDANKGSDSSDGHTEVTAWKSFGKLDGILQAGDTVYLKSGNYYGSISIQTGSFPNNPVRILAYNSTSYPYLYGDTKTETIRASFMQGLTISGLIFYRNYSTCISTWNTSYVTVDSCEFIGSSALSSLQPAMSILGDDGARKTIFNIIVRNNIMYGWTNTNSLQITQAVNVLVEGNECQSQQDKPCFQLYNTGKAYVRENSITNGYAGLAMMSEASWDSTGNIVENNVIRGMTDNSITFEVRNSVIRNNNISTTALDGIFFWTSPNYSTNGTKIYGNIITNVAGSDSNAAGLTLNAQDYITADYIGSYKILNNIVQANGTLNPPVLKIDYYPYSSDIVTEFESHGWQFFGNCFSPDRFFVQGSAKTLEDLTADPNFNTWVTGNVIVQDSDFVVSGDPSSGLYQSSPCKLAKVPLTKISQSSSKSKTIHVEDSRFFSDGAEVTNGDTIVIGDDCRWYVSIDTVIDDYTILLNASVSTKIGDSVTLAGMETCSRSSSSPSDSTKKLVPIIVGAGGGGLLLIVAAIVFAIFIRKKKAGTGENHSTEDKRNKEEHGTVSIALETPSPQSTTLSTHQIKIVEAIGEGKFGAVYKGMYNKTTPVALKKLKSENKGMEFSREVSLLSRLRHPNIIMFHGIWLSPESEEYMVFEFVNKGNLLDLLQQQSESLTTETLQNMALQVASGMSYLEQMKIVHRDLAARNILVKEEGGSYILKISDFGLSRQTSDNMYQGNDNELPVRWTAPEALIYNTHSHKSDVWSFGILLWEMWEYGKTPYPQFTNAVTRQKVVEGYRLNSPQGCPKQIFDLMKRCWNEKPNQRPSFSEIEALLSSTMQDVPSLGQKTQMSNNSSTHYMKVTPKNSADLYQNQHHVVKHYESQF